MSNETKYLRVKHGNSFNRYYKHYKIVGETKTQWRLEGYPNIRKDWDYQILSENEYKSILMKEQDEKIRYSFNRKFKDYDYTKLTLAQINQIDDLLNSFTI